MKRALSLFYRLLASNGLACMVLLLLFVLTLLGTLEEGRLGLFEVQKRYFSSLVLLHPLPGGLKLPLPGGALLMMILGVNLLLGGMMRVRRNWSSIGLFIVHGGIVLLLLGGLITHELATEGQMVLAPGETASHFESSQEWELAIVDTSHPDRDTEYLIPMKDFAGLSGGHSRSFQPEGLPFSLGLSGFSRNAAILPKDPAQTPPAEVIDGFYVKDLGSGSEPERNSPALYLTLEDKPGGPGRRQILWGFSPAPLNATFGGKTYELALRRTQWTLPFAVTLKKFIREFHPGTDIAKTYQSEVVKTEGGNRQELSIRMNEPLRHKGYTLFQSSFFENPKTGEFSSILAVVKNPADQIPLYSCYMITLGLLLHFGVRLAGHLKSRKESQA